MTEVPHGHLTDPGDAPGAGERFDLLTEREGVTIEHILSARSDTPNSYLQDHDEWVVVLTGSATVDVGGTPYRLGAGDWVLLPRGIPHTVERTETATTWLAVHLPADDGSETLGI
ncbi:MAG: cupin domain-containing protein [Acidimicrobiales bacterium]|nr:cupin domain-containing protein [Acidimicrobiales bacterium]